MWPPPSPQPALSPAVPTGPPALVERDAGSDEVAARRAGNAPPVERGSNPGGACRPRR